MNVAFAGTVVATFYRIVKQTEHGVTVVLIVLGSIDTTLCGNMECARRGESWKQKALLTL